MHFRLLATAVSPLIRAEPSLVSFKPQSARASLQQISERQGVGPGRKRQPCLGPAIFDDEEKQDCGTSGLIQAFHIFITISYASYSVYAIVSCAREMLSRVRPVAVSLRLGLPRHLIRSR